MTPTAPMPTQSLIGAFPEEVAPHLPARFREPYRARQILHWIHGKGTVRFEQMTDLPAALRDALPDVFRLGVLREAKRTTSKSGDATKYLWRLDDDRLVESVHLVLPTRETFCISSQVGCAYGCTFCATATMGFIRHLTSREIVEQVYRMREVLRERDGINPGYNVVFMGMGEPLANYANVVDAILRLTHPGGIALSEKRITLSTCGLAHRIRRLAKEGLKVGLAVSLNATTDELRRTTMPVTKKHGIEDVLDAAREYARASGRRVTLEYVLLKGVNDTVEDAERLSTLANSLPSKINLIPFNPFPGNPLERPDDAWVRAFLDRLTSSRAPAVTLRTTRGLDIAAACGQLAVSA